MPSADISRFLKSAKGIVVGLHGLTVFVDGSFALARNVEDLAQLDMAPDLRPARLPVAVNGGAIGICRGLVFLCRKKISAMR